MKLLFEHKKPGRIRETIEPVEMEISGVPSTVGQLVACTVEQVVEDFNRRSRQHVERADDDAHTAILSEQDIQNLSQTGRIAFGLLYNEK